MVIAGRELEIAPPCSIAPRESTTEAGARRLNGITLDEVREIAELLLHPE